MLPSANQTRRSKSVPLGRPLDRTDRTKLAGEIAFDGVAHLGRNRTEPQGDAAIRRAEHSKHSLFAVIEIERAEPAHGIEGEEDRSDRRADSI